MDMDDGSLAASSRGSPQSPLSLNMASLPGVPRHNSHPSTSSQNAASNDDTTSQVLKDVRGFYQVTNEDDLLQCMEGLNALFNRAVEFESPIKQLKQSQPSSPAARRPKTAAAAGALTPRSAKQKEYEDQAIEILNGPPRQLEDLLQTSAIQAAMNATGIVYDELQPKTRDDFTKEKHRAWSVPEDVASLRFKHYDKTRKHNLALLLQVAAEERPQVDDPNTETDHCKYSKELAHEHKLLQEMIKGRLKYEKILEKEAAKLARKRAQYLVLDHGVPLRRPGESDAVHVRQQMNAEKADQNRAKMERVQHQRELLEQTRQQNADARRRFEKSKQESLTREKAQVTREKRSREEDRQKKRQQVLHEAKASDLQRRVGIQSTLDDKAKYISASNTYIILYILWIFSYQEQALRDKKVAMLRHQLLQKETKRLVSQEREANVAHMKNVQAFQKQLAARKIQANYRRIDNLKEVKQAIVDERNRIHKLAGIRYSHCKDLSDEIRLTPGPGEYNPPPLTKRATGGMWSPLPKGPTNQLHATPGPGAYDHSRDQATSGTTFAKSRLLNSLQSQLGPGPGQYISAVKCSTFNPHKGPLFPSSNVASPFEMALRRAADLPVCGPMHIVDDDENVRRHRATTRRARFRATWRRRRSSLSARCTP
ncbi:hypothetical protein, variant 1 [Aphanomyces astaci]|uniref:Uncharacterized protein n=1 Tax=Aphanomyces astaci TaxID=112090 RepID=W4GQ28_APHAT|nr:hypothetical protein, variant 1 [Aphanomyces astaci]ETV81099.1 hypothetical protein, variant 1 [Aphanomyces astaci]|eukprot:XP_009828959.1 hypothetical protein, variant 1 [Aphanomyces astaci]